MAVSDTVARQALAKSNGSGYPTQQDLPSRPVSAHELAADWRKGPSSDPQSIIDAIVATKSGAETAGKIGYVPRSTTVLPPSGTRPDEKKKEYCTHWIRTGECDYTQQGCLYKHEMPDKATLIKIGFRGEVPRWYQEKATAIKIGGAKGSAAPIVKPSLFSQTRDHGSESSDAGDTASETSGSSRGTQNHEYRSDSAGGKRNEAMRLKKGQDEQHRASSLNERKQSKAEDLISFEPLVPISPLSIPSSVASSNHSLCSFPGDKSTASEGEAEQSRAIKSDERTKIFVPKGESAKTHIADAKKRRSHNISDDLHAHNKIERKPLDKPIQLPQNNRNGGGLMASEHANPIHREPTVDADRSASRVRSSPRTGRSRKRVPASKKIMAE